MAGLLSRLHWAAGLQAELLAVAWHAFQSAAARGALLRFRNQLWPYLPANKLRVMSVDELFPGIRCDLRLRAGNFEPQHRHYYRAAMHHVCVIAAIAAHLKPRSIFEFGTNRGEMTANFLLNTADYCRIFTLDLPPEHSATQFPLPEHERSVAQDTATGHLGEQYKRLPGAAARITQILTDSAEFDSGPYEGSMDFIFVDAAHTYEYVANDSRHAFRMLRPGGVIIWDDCGAEWPGVVQFLNGEAQRRPICHIEGTELAIYRDPAAVLR